MKKLQVLTDNGWRYVFCYNRQSGIVTTDIKRNALPQAAIYGQSDLKYFSNKYGNNSFRLSTG